MTEYKNIVLAVTTIGSFMGSLDGSIINIAIPTISSDLNSPFEIIQWVTIAYLLVLAISLVALGRLGDLRGRRNYFLLGILIFTVASLACSLAITPLMLVSFRVIQGLGSSLVVANAPAMVTEAFPPQERGKALGINVASIYLGLTIGPVLGGVLVQFLSWRSIFYVNVPIGGIVLPLGLKYLLKSETGQKKEIFDTPGMIAFGIFLAPLLLMLTLGNTLGWANYIILVCIIVTGVGLVVFLIIESRARAPMIDLGLFRHNRMFAAANITALLNYVGLNGVLFLMSIYLQSFRGLAAMNAGLLLLLAPLTQSLVSLRTGRLSDRIGTRLLCSLGMIIIAAGIFFTILVVNFLPIEFLVFSFFTMGVGTGLFSSPNQSAIMGSVGKKDLGIASGVLATMRTTGQSVSVALLSAIVGFFIPISLLNTAIATQRALGVAGAVLTQFQAGMSMAYWVSIGLCILGAFAALFRGKFNNSVNTASG